MNQMSPIRMTTDVEPVEFVRTAKLQQRAARRGELAYVHTRLMEAIDSVEEFSEEFRNFERARLSKRFIANLHALDPNYVRVCFSDDVMVGFLLSGPERGNLWYYWGYSFPEVRDPKHAMAFLRMFLEYWDNGRFHKVSLFTTRGNAPTRALMKRFGFHHKCDLDDHIMGQSFMLFERQLNKVEPGYDTGSIAPLRVRLMNRVRCVLGLV